MGKAVVQALYHKKTVQWCGPWWVNNLIGRTSASTGET